MKTQLTTRDVLRVILCVLALGCHVRAGEIFLDDFSDGSIQDGSPVTWGWDPRQGDMGECMVTPEGLQVTPDWPAHKEHPMARIDRDAYGRNVHYAGSITVRTQVKMPEATTGFGSSVLLFLRTNLDLDTGYFVCINRQYLWICRMDGHELLYSPWEWHYQMNGRFDATKDVMIQFDAIDLTDNAGNRTTNRLEARCWVAGQEMPVQPQLVAYDAKYEAGGIAIGASSDSELNRTAIFRWIEVTYKPIVDFNGDGTVDMKDLLKLIEAWGQDDPAVDIVPDGVVDKKDLEVLMDHWQQEVNDPTLLAHWALDETEGIIASDSAGGHDGTVTGLPTWQPAGGAVDGALECNGTTFVVTDPVLNPSDGPFSIFAWVKGGAPGQAILSQQADCEWLLLDPATGVLLTGLKSGGRFGKALYSDTIITDGNWHRLGFTWDGSNRLLYVDNVLVAEDTQTGLMGCSGGLNIGCGKNMAAGTFWSGLIDDVRIYDRAVKP